MSPDFIQIGFQKCGTTFLEKNVYPKNSSLNVIQAAKYLDLENILLNHLILPDRLEFDLELFQQSFNKYYSPFYQKSKINGACLKHLHFYMKEGLIVKMLLKD